MQIEKKTFLFIVAEVQTITYIHVLSVQKQFRGERHKLREEEKKIAITLKPLSFAFRFPFPFHSIQKWARTLEEPPHAHNNPSFGCERFSFGKSLSD